MRKKIIVIFILISLSVMAAHKAHSVYLKDVHQELEGKQLENKKNWIKIVRNMTTDRVKEILGEPERISEGVTTIWFYQKGGSVSLLGGKVVKWDRPFNWDY